MIRRPPRSTLFPTRRSSDLEHERDAPRTDAARREEDRPQRARVEPLQVVDDGEDLLLLGRDARDREHGGGHREGVVRRRSEEHTSELQSRQYLVCRLLLEKK